MMQAFKNNIHHSEIHISMIIRKNEKVRKTNYTVKKR